MLDFAGKIGRMFSGHHIRHIPDCLHGVAPMRVNHSTAAHNPQQPSIPVISPNPQHPQPQSATATHRRLMKKPSEFLLRE